MSNCNELPEGLVYQLSRMIDEVDLGIDLSPIINLLETYPDLMNHYYMDRYGKKEIPFLHKVVLLNSLELTAAFLNLGLSPNIFGEDRVTPFALLLTKAEKEGLPPLGLECLRLLKEAGANVMARSFSGVPALIQFGALIDFNAFKELLPENLDWSRLQNGRPLLSYFMESMFERKQQVYKENLRYVLINRVTNVNPIVESIHHHPLGVALAYGHIDVAELLVNLGADLELKDSRGRGFIFAAAHPASVFWFQMKKPEQLHLRDEEGKTALMHRTLAAVKSNFPDDIEVVTALIAVGLNLDEFDNAGPAFSKTPREIIMDSDVYELIDLVMAKESKDLALSILDEINANHFKKT